MLTESDSGKTNLPVRNITPILRMTYDYWNARRGDRAMPARRDIDPGEIRSLLPHLVLLDVLQNAPDEPPRDFRLRLVGTSVETHFSGPRTGRLLSEFMPREPGSIAWDKLDRVVRTAQPSFDRVPYVGPHHEFLAFCDVVLPLSDDGRSVNMLMMAMDFVSREFTGP